LLFSKRTKVYFRNLRETTMHLAKLDEAFNFSCTWRDSPQVIPVFFCKRVRETTMHLAKLDGAFNFSCTWRDSPQVIPVDIFIYILGKTKKHLALLNTALYSRRTRYNTR